MRQENEEKDYEEQKEREKEDSAAIACWIKQNEKRGPQSEHAQRGVYLGCSFDLRRQAFAVKRNQLHEQSSRCKNNSCLICVDPSMDAKKIDLYEWVHPF